MEQSKNPLRPCLLAGHGRQVEVALFHRFADGQKPCKIKNNVPQGIKTYALVELENGSLELQDVGCVIFLDSLEVFMAYDWEKLVRQHEELLRKLEARRGG